MYSCANMEVDFLFSTNLLDFSPEKVCDLLDFSPEKVCDLGDFSPEKVLKSVENTFMLK